MFALKGKQDGFRFLLPNEFIPEEINEKYTKKLLEAQSFFTKPIDFVNESIQKVEVLGINQATVIQQQTNFPTKPLFNKNSIEKSFIHTSSDFVYRSETSPLNLVEKTLNVEFRHSLGYLNYFIIFESFWYHYSRGKKYFDLVPQFTIDILNNKGFIYSKIVLEKPIIDGIDMLSFDFTQPVAQSQNFRVIFKYSNFDYQFIQYEDPENVNR